ncbi:hypothetical protein AMTR_s00033p00201280 [Amborella trichopoda]|uniref:Uncharacterized protein n=1 Tax=Amborella trichopoda TaxID=13333 RepID=U5CMG3_AMBTC|nr:hypothetical protein AMTR_s00033p00201280 [Amborella trichopoda]
MNRAAEQLVGIEHDVTKSTPSQHRFCKESSSIKMRLRRNEVSATPPARVSFVGIPILKEDDIENDFFCWQNRILIRGSIEERLMSLEVIKGRRPSFCEATLSIWY